MSIFLIFLRYGFNLMSSKAAVISVNVLAYSIKDKNSFSVLEFDLLGSTWSWFFNRDEFLFYSWSFWESICISIWGSESISLNNSFSLI